MPTSLKFAFCVLLLAAAAVPEPAAAQSVFGTVSPRQVSYIGTLTYTATASGLDPSTTRYAYFRRRPGGTWIPSVNAPNWTSSTSFTWNPTLSDVGVWETYVWAKDAYTPASANGGYGYAAGHNTQPIEVFGPPTVPGPTSASCAWSDSGVCWVTGDFVISVSPSTGGLGSLIYHICRSNDTTGWGGCDVHLTMNGGTSITVSGSHLPSDGYRRVYYFQSRDSAGAYSGWNTPLYVKIDRYAPSVGASNASDLWYSYRTATISASDSHSGLQSVRYSWNAALNSSCTSGTSTSSGATLVVPGGDNMLYVCARDNTGRVGQWSGRYRVAPLTITSATISPTRGSYLSSFTSTATAAGGTPSTTRFAFFRRRPGGTWTPSVTAPVWQTSNVYTWQPALADVGLWETYIWVKDGDTPPTSNTYGYSAGYNTGTIEVVGKPTVPGPTTVACAYAVGDDCWVQGDFTASVTASTGGMGTLNYHICRSNDTTGWGGCDVHLTFTGGPSILVSGTHLPPDGYRRAYYFQTQDSAGAYSGWNTPRYVRVDRYAPTVSASNASDTEWFYSRAATVSASDAHSGVQSVRYAWNAALDANCTTGTATSIGASLNAPVGDNRLYLCAKDNSGRVGQWNGRYRIAQPLSLTGSISPSRGSYLGTFTYIANASGGIPSSTRYAFFRRRSGTSTWIPDVTMPNWQAGNQFVWQPALADVGFWDTYIWVKDSSTPANQNTYGYAAGYNTGQIEVVGKPTIPGPTTVACAYTTVDDCWVQGDFTATVTASTGGMGTLNYHICRSNDATGWGGCDVHLTFTGGASILVSGSHLPSDGYRRGYYFQTQDSAGAYSGWNTPRFVRVDRYAPVVNASNASDVWFSYRAATVSASDTGSGVQSVRYSWNTALDANCTTGTATSTGAVLTAPGGDNLLYLCAKDNTGRIAQWNGRYRVAPLGLTGTVSPSRGSYLGTFTYTANATGGTPATMRFAFFRRRPGGTWIPAVTAPTWQTGNQFVWQPALADVGFWETYIWVKDGDTPPTMNTYGYGAGANTGTIEVVGKPTVPGPTTVTCAWTSGEDCWVQGDFTASVTASTGGMGSLVYQICRSNDTTGFGGCEVNLTLSGGTSILVSGAHLPGDGFRRSYWFQAQDSAGALSGWNTQKYVRVDRYAPLVSATNASDVWFSSRTAVLSASDTGSGLQGVRYSWNTALDAGCTTGTATTSGTTLTAPGGDNLLYLCAKDNTGRVAQWNGRYRVAPLGLSGMVSPTRGSYLKTFTYTANATGGTPATMRFAFFRRRPNGTWIPDVNNPTWQTGNTFTWQPALADVGFWETYIWVKDGDTPPTMNTYGYGAGANTGTIEVVGKPTVPGPTTVICAHTSGEDCWVQGDFTASVTASTGGMGTLVYQICRSNDSAGGFAGCEENLTLTGGTSILVSGAHLPGDGFRRSYWFQAKDSEGALSGWNTQRYVRVDRYAPLVSANNASNDWNPNLTATVSAADDSGGAGSNSGLLHARYLWNTALDAACTTGATVAPGTTLTPPAGDNTLYLCARDNVGRVTQWNGRYRLGDPLRVIGSISPTQGSYLGSFTYTATASGGGNPTTRRFAFFRRRPGQQDWIPPVTAPNWQPGHQFTWNTTIDDVGVWETYIWVKDGDTPPDMNGYGFAAGYNTMPIEVVGKPTVPGPTTVSCAWTSGEDCWVKSDFVASVTPSTGGLGSLVYQICRSHDSAGGFAGCEENLTLAGGPSVMVTEAHLPGDGFRRSYWFQAKDTAGALSGWNTPRYVRVDRYPPSISATNASEEWFESRTATVLAADDDEAATFNSGLAEVRYSWNTALDAACTAGTAVTSGTTLDAPDGDNVLYLCARDNAGWIAQWSGRYRAGENFSVDITPAFATVAPGGQAHFTISLTEDPVFTGTAALSVSDLPASFSPTLQPVAIGAGQTADLTVTTTASAPEGISEITVTATAGSLTRTVSAQVRVANPQAPVLTRITPDSFSNGGIVRVTVEGSFLSGSTVSIAQEQANPDDPKSRVFPTAQVVSINSAGTSMEVDIDATDVNILDFHNLVVDNGTDIEAMPFRVLPKGPLVDAWTPSEPEVGGLYALSIAGRHLAGTTVTPSAGGRVALHSVETSETEITALLEVLPNAPTGTMLLIVADGAGRTAEVEITIVGPQQSSLANRNLTASASEDGEELDDSSYRRPTVWFQEFTIRDPDRTEVLTQGLRIHPIGREELGMRLRTGSSFYWGVYIKIVIPLVRVQWQKVILFDPVTGAIGDAVLQALGVGVRVPIGAFVISAYFELDLTIYWMMNNFGHYTFPLFCIEIRAGIEITGFKGFAYHDSFCIGGGWRAWGKGSVANGEMTGGDCASVEQTSFQDGILEGTVEQTACCSQPIRVKMSGHTFSGLPWGKSFNIDNPQAGATTSDQATCPCPCLVTLDGTALTPGTFTTGNIRLKNTSNEPCTYQYEVKQYAGLTQMDLSNHEGTLTVEPQQTAVQPFTVTFPADRAAPDVATLAVEIQHTNPEGGEQKICQSSKISCVYPGGETSTFEGWWPVQPSADVARFLGHLTPSSASFTGRAVSEIAPGTGSFDHCHDQNSPFPNWAQNNLTGGIWNIVAGNQYHEADVIGMKCASLQQCDLDGYYAAVGRAPCSMGTTQRMQMSCGPMQAGSGVIPYVTNTIRIDVTTNGTRITRGNAASNYH